MIAGDSGSVPGNSLRNAAKNKSSSAILARMRCHTDMRVQLARNLCCASGCTWSRAAIRWIVARSRMTTPCERRLMQRATLSPVMQASMKRSCTAIAGVTSILILARHRPAYFVRRESPALQQRGGHALDLAPMLAHEYGRVTHGLEQHLPRQQSATVYSAHGEPR